ncbi:MAG: CHAT domain-containing protein [Leptolyngbya sp. DLM2.Bin15]|nr:MAG: CHAT domain-containing protein [Leptolyngbya sp. DLM2.Bin15]
MDEQRVQAYVELIEQLLGCPQGEEAALLHANAELLDAELLLVMEQYADWLESQGNGNASWLRQFAAQLPQAMELREGSPTSQSQEGAAAFALEIMQLIAQTRGDQVQVYAFLRANVGQLDELLLQALPDLFGILIQQNEPMLIAAMFILFGNLIVEFPLGSRMLNMELSIITFQQALRVITREARPVEWAESMNNLAIAYRNRIQGDRAQNIEDAIAAYQQVLQVMTRENQPVNWASSMVNLANAYYSRIWGDRAQNIEDAIAAYQQALQVRTSENLPIKWAASINNLANAYQDRIRGDRAQNIEDAIAAYQQALQVRTRENLPVEWAESMMNLANAYRKRIQGDRAQNIEESIAAYQQALQVKTREKLPVDWAELMMNVANAYYSRIQGDQAQNIEDAITAYQQALQVRTRETMPVEWATSIMNLANAYSDRIRGDKAQNLEDAITAYQSSLEIFTPELLPDDCRRSACSLANLYSDQQRWQEAAQTYQIALQAAETLYQSALLLDSKAAELATTADLPRRAAYALACTGQLSQAVEVLERGRARGLSESLERDRADLSRLEQTYPALYQQYQALTAQLRNLENQQRDLATSSQRHDLTPTDLRDTATTLRDQLNQTLTQIRQVEGYVGFLVQPSFDDIRAALRPDNPLIYLVTTPNGSMSLILTGQILDVLWLDNLTEEALRAILYGPANDPEISRYLGAYQDFRNDSKANYSAWCQEIDTTTHQLWNALMGPLIQKIKELGFDRITLIPTGYLSLLPLHAAWTEDLSTCPCRRYALDEIHITYTPNAQSLNAAQAISDRVQANSILAIDNPRQDLLNSEREVQSAISPFLPQATILRHNRATTTAVKTTLPQAEIAHFSCHGTANPREPLTSGLLMHDGLLTLKDIFALNLADTTQGNPGLRLAILSACETGMIGIENADEAISLPTGLLQAGVAAVIASLWSVSDRSTMLLLTKFYDLWRKDGLEPGQALRQAQIWLRDSTAGEIAAYGGFFTPTPDERPYTHPFHWAAFSYTGI